MVVLYSIKVIVFKNLIFQNDRIELMQRTSTNKRPLLIFYIICTFHKQIFTYGERSRVCYSSRHDTILL